MLAGVIVASVCTAFLYRRQTRGLEASSAAAQQRLAEVAASSFTNMRTVRIFAGEALEQQRFGRQVAAAYAGGLGFARAKAMLESECPAARPPACRSACLPALCEGGWMLMHAFPACPPTCLRGGPPA